MGFKTFWAQLSGQKTEEVALRTLPCNTNHKAATTVYLKELENQSSTYNIPPASVSQAKAGRVSRKRKSWFGGRPTPEQSIPPVPALNEIIIQPGTVLTKDTYAKLGVLPEPSIDEEKRKSRRISLSRKLSLRSARNKPEDLPPMPLLPPMLTSSTSTPQTERQKSRTFSFGRKLSEDTTSQPKQSRRRSSFWESSNPDNSDDDSIPPVPSLVRDGSQSPENRRRRPSQLTRRPTDHSQQSNSGSSSIPQNRRTYTPKNAAGSFLISTSGASDSTRKSFRKSFRIADDEQLVCLSDEQRREWEKLRAVSSASSAAELDRRDSADSSLRIGPGNEKYSNKEALAALEFGLRG